MDLKESDILGAGVSDHWYYRSKAEAISRLLCNVQPKSILDIGAGSGFFSRYLLDGTTAHEAWCVDNAYDRDSDSFQIDKPIHFRQSIDNNESDLVLLVDVLEHIDDDVGFLRSYVNKVPHGAKFLISVPAFEFLWSGHDIFLEHRRRYQLEQIKEVAQHAGLSVSRGAYYFGGVFPIAAAMRLVSRLSRHNMPVRSQLSKHHPVINGVLNTICRLELPLMRFNKLAGLTAFCLAEKV
jgi:SAM-dependent methyltransferase